MESDTKKSCGHSDLDIESHLKKVVGKSGKVVNEYGGFIITTLDNKNFPWYEVLNTLVGDCFEVWIERENSNLRIVTKQKLD